MWNIERARQIRTLNIAELSRKSFNALQVQVSESKDRISTVSDEIKFEFNQQARKIREAANPHSLLKAGVLTGSTFIRPPDVVATARAAVRTAVPNANVKVAISGGEPNPKGDINITVDNNITVPPAQALPTAETRIIERVVTPTPDSEFTLIRSADFNNLLRKNAEKAVEEARPKIEAEAEARGKVKGEAKAKAQIEVSKQAQPTTQVINRAWGFPWDPPWGIILGTVAGFGASAVILTRHTVIERIHHHGPVGAPHTHPHP